MLKQKWKIVARNSLSRKAKLAKTWNCFAE